MLMVAVLLLLVVVLLFQYPEGYSWLCYSCFP